MCWIPRCSTCITDGSPALLKTPEPPELAIGGLFHNLANFAECSGHYSGVSGIGKVAFPARSLTPSRTSGRLAGQQGIPGRHRYMTPVQAPLVAGARVGCSDIPLPGSVSVPSPVSVPGSVRAGTNRVSAAISARIFDTTFSVTGTGPDG